MLYVAYVGPSILLLSSQVYLINISVIAPKFRVFDQLLQETNQITSSDISSSVNGKPVNNF